MVACREAGLNGDLFEEFGESPESVASWSIPDPNLVDSDGDTLPDGWEADSQCTWSPLRIGVNPLNGSDMFENPDGDGYDVNKDGVLTPNEMFVNYLEYHIRSGLFLNNLSSDGTELPNGFTTDLFNNISDFGSPKLTLPHELVVPYSPVKSQSKRVQPTHSVQIPMKMECRMVGKSGLLAGM